MKTFLLSLFILCTFQLYGQKNKQVKTDRFFHVQGGFFFEQDAHQSFSGFNIFNIGLSQAKGKTLQSVEVELINFTANGDTKINASGIEIGNIRERQSIELIYTRSYALIGELTNGFSLGPTASFLINSNKKRVTVSSAFPKEEICYCLGLGVKAGYNRRISEKIMLNFSTRITLVDLGSKQAKVKNPSLPIRQQNSSGFDVDFLRKQFPLMVGISFNF